jgi:hypothetical protein
MLSDSSNSTAAELKALDQRIMNEDSLVPAFNTETSDDSMLLEEALNIYSSTDTELVELSSQTTKRKRSDLKVEGPLTPIMSSESPMKKIKSVTFKEMVAEYIPELPPTSDSENYNFSDFFKDATPLLEQVNKTITNEKLSEVDTTKRVDVPDVDFTLPIAPWAEFSRAKIGQPRDEETELEAQRKFLLEIKRNTLKSTPSWHRLSKPEREMDWNPFPTGMGRVTIEEELHGEDVLHDILAELTAGDIATSSTDIWKRDGLRILEDDDSDEEELEVAEFEEARTVETLVKKRILEIDDQTFRHESKPKGLNRETGVIGRPQRIERYREREQISAPRRQKGVPEQVPPEKKNENYLMFGGTFSATSALQNFMEVNGKNTPVEPSRSTQTSTHLPSMKKPKVNQPLCSTRGQSAAGTWSSHFPEVWNGEQENHGPPLSPLPQLPPIPGQLTPCSFIISSTLLIQRRLAREIEKIYPSAEMVERDFSLPHSPAQEADLLLSPSTGLIFTTLQQVKQQALPGQKNTSPIKERILGLQIRYERLIVLVGEGLSREAEQSRCARPVDSRDQGALAEFDKFTSRMEADVTTQYVRGGELALARTIVGEMAKWSLPHGSTDMGDLKLLQDETYVSPLPEHIHSSLSKCFPLTFSFNGLH